MPELAIHAAQRLTALGGDAQLARDWLLPVWERQARAGRQPEGEAGRRAGSRPGQPGRRLAGAHRSRAKSQPARCDAAIPGRHGLHEAPALGQGAAAHEPGGDGPAGRRSCTAMPGARWRCWPRSAATTKPPPRRGSARPATRPAALLSLIAAAGCPARTAASARASRAWFPPAPAGPRRSRSPAAARAARATGLGSAAIAACTAAIFSRVRIDPLQAGAFGDLRQFVDRQLERLDLGQAGAGAGAAGTAGRGASGLRRRGRGCGDSGFLVHEAGRVARALSPARRLQASLRLGAATACFGAASSRGWRSPRSRRSRP